MAGGGRDQALDVVLIERLAAGDGVEQVPVDTDHEVSGEIHPLNGNLGARADGDPDRGARDGHAGTTFEDGMEVVRAGVPAARTPQPQPVAQQRANQRRVGGTAPVQPAARAQLACQLIEAFEPAVRLDTGAVVGREPERTFGDIAIPRGAFEHGFARLQSLHGR